MFGSEVQCAPNDTDPLILRSKARATPMIGAAGSMGRAVSGTGVRIARPNAGGHRGASRGKRHEVHAMAEKPLQ